jgi:Family of unknown function (DUF5706)
LTTPPKGKFRSRPQPEIGPDEVDLPERAWKILDEVSARIEHADVKAGVVLGACGVAAVAILGLLANHHGHHLPLLLALTASGIFVLASAACASTALWPRRMRRTAPRNLLYFDHISRGPFPDAAAYGRKLRELLADSDALVQEIADEIWANSIVTSRKYTWLDRSIVSLFVALFALGVAAAISGAG